MLQILIMLSLLCCQVWPRLATGDRWDSIASYSFARSACSTWFGLSPVLDATKIVDSTVGSDVAAVKLSPVWSGYSELGACILYGIVGLILILTGVIDGEVFHGS